MGDQYKTEAARQRARANLRPAAPAAKGNALAAKHGAYRQVSEVERSERERQVLNALAASAPLRDADGGLPASDELVVSMLAESLVRRERVARWLADYGPLDAKTGAPKPAVELERRLRSEALDLCRELGLTPRSRLALGLQLQQGLDLAQQAAADHERERREGGGDA